MKYPNLYSLAIVLAAFAFAAWMYPHIPSPVPTHWNSAGHIDGYTPKPWGVFVMPMIMAGVWLLFALLPAISPKGFRLDEFLDTYTIFQLAVLGMLLVVTVAALLEASGQAVPIDRLVPITLGVLMMTFGNYMGKIRKNFFIGIRTPWTLASDEVWARTHRFAGWLFIGAGAVVIAQGVLGWDAIVLFIAVGVAALVPAAYSYWLYRRLET